MLIVQKYGGSSLQDADRIRQIAARVLKTQRSGHEVVVVCSAMGDSSDELIDLAEEVSGNRPAREMDMLLTSGERVSNALMAMAVHDLGGSARSLSGDQAGIFTDADHGAAGIVEVDPVRVREVLARGAVALVAGFQGLCRETGDITTLGRGGSDVTAVALAAALDADVCEIYTDVDGVFSADPRVVAGARLLETVSSTDMLEMAATGAKVLMSRCVEYARRHGVEICVRSSFTDGPGTLVSQAPSPAGTTVPRVTGVTHTGAMDLVTVADPPTGPAAGTRVSMLLAEVSMLLAEARTPADMVQTVATPAGSEVVFTVPAAEAPRTVGLLERHRDRLGYGPVRRLSGFGRVSLVGAGHPGAAGVVAALAGAGIGVRLTAASGLRVSALCAADRLHDAVRALHTACALDTATEAVVHAGTGR
ncbi:aspartate kinase [Streptomyces sp. NPDC058319]|uniref:aspartate kinase n=1 Tax=unclassified Streptomyces TaxID=2593676 RepID=UPI0036E0F79A